MPVSYNAIGHLANALEEIQVARPGIAPGDHFQFIARSRSQGSNTHFAKEIGLKAMLNYAGVLERDRRGHDLHELLGKLRQKNPSAFNDIDRCFEKGVRLCEQTTGHKRLHLDIFSEFNAHYNHDAYLANKYWSIEEGSEIRGSIPIVAMEVIRALLAIMREEVPNDVDTRIETEATHAVISANALQPEAWVNWLSIHENRVKLSLENTDDSNRNKAIRRALRICQKESSDIAIQWWARHFRRMQLEAFNKGISNRIGRISQLKLRSRFEEIRRSAARKDRT